jgi:hypothetical protein
MFYHGNLKDGANVKKIDFRPLYLNGPNTRIEPKIETLSDGYSEEGREEGREEGGEGEEGTEEHEGDRVDSSALLVEAKSSSSASSFLSSLTSMYKNGSQSKSLNKDTENPDKTKSNENKMSKERYFETTNILQFTHIGRLLGTWNRIWDRQFALSFQYR